MARGRKPGGDRVLTATERQRRSRAMRQFNSERRYAEDERRDKPIALKWTSSLLGRITIDDEHWASVEWSEKHQCWCIEDVTGACLAHEESISGAAANKDAAVALAEAMIRDGRIPTPQEARWARLPEGERPSLSRRAAPAPPTRETRPAARCPATCRRAQAPGEGAPRGNHGGAGKQSRTNTNNHRSMS